MGDNKEDKADTMTNKKGKRSETGDKNQEGKRKQKGDKTDTMTNNNGDKNHMCNLCVNQLLEFAQLQAPSHLDL